MSAATSPVPQPISPLGEGAVIAGKYRLGPVLGAGGMGVVHVAEHLGLGERVAMKFLHAQYAGSEAIVERFLREARAQFRIKSDHVVRVLDVGTAESGAPYIAMELLEGASLGDVCEATPRLPWDLACELVRQACEALESAHQLGIVHRDVKPGNLMVCPSAGGVARVKLLDFGIAQIARTEGLSRLTMTEAVIGTPLYMAPEQMRSARATDLRSDLWSIGVVLYRLLTGVLPFYGESLADLVVLQHHAPAPRVDTLAKVPAEIVDAVARCLSLAPADRFATAAELAAVLARFARPVMAADLLQPVLALRQAEAQAVGVGLGVVPEAPGTARLPTPAPTTPAPTTHDTPRPHSVPPSMPPAATEGDAAGLTFVRRKVHDTSGATAFAVHELAPRDERNMTTGPRNAPALAASSRVSPLVVAAGIASAVLLVAVTMLGMVWTQRRSADATTSMHAPGLVATSGSANAAAPAPEPAPALAPASEPVVEPSTPAPVVLPATAASSRRPLSGAGGVGSSAARPDTRPAAAASSPARPSIYTEKW